MSSSPACLEFGLSLASSPRIESCKNRRGKGSKRATAVVETRNEKRIRVEKPSSAQSAWQRDLRRASTGLTSPRLSSKWGELGHGQFVDSVLERMPVKNEMRLYRAKVDVLAVFKTNTKIPRGVSDKVLYSCSSLLARFFHPALSTKQTSSPQLKR